MRSQSRFPIRALLCLLPLELVAAASITNEPLLSATSALRGRIAATINAQRGEYELLSFGFSLPDPFFNRIMSTKYHVGSIELFGCVGPQWQKNYIDGYNAVMGHAIEQKFGGGVIAAAWRDAERAANLRQALR